MSSTNWVGGSLSAHHLWRRRGPTWNAGLPITSAGFRPDELNDPPPENARSACGRSRAPPSWPWSMSPPPWRRRWRSSTRWRELLVVGWLGLRCQLSLHSCLVLSRHSTKHLVGRRVGVLEAHRPVLFFLAFQPLLILGSQRAAYVVAPACTVWVLMGRTRRRPGSRARSRPEPEDVGRC